MVGDYSMNNNFLGDNEHRVYPFIDLGIPYMLTRSSDASTFALPDQTIVDLLVTLPEVSKYDPTIRNLSNTILPAQRTGLSSISRSGDVFTFTVGSLAPGVTAWVLKFTHKLTDSEFMTSRAKAIDPATGNQPVASPPDCNSGWFPMNGYLVTGDLAPLAALLADGDTATADETIPLEEVLVQLDRGVVNSITLVNAPRIMALTNDCSGSGDDWSDPTKHENVLYTSCMTGNMVFVEGYNTKITQNDATQTITFSGRVGAGLGQPTEEVPIEQNEAPPPGSPYLSGGKPCKDAYQSINGIQGPNIRLEGGPGVTIEPHPFLTHRLVVSFNLAGSGVCNPVSFSSLGSETSEVLSSLKSCSSQT
jgi:hypothetical protein